MRNRLANGEQARSCVRVSTCVTAMPTGLALETTLRITNEFAIKSHPAVVGVGAGRDFSPAAQPRTCIGRVRGGPRARAHGDHVLGRRVARVRSGSGPVTQTSGTCELANGSIRL